MRKTGRYFTDGVPEVEYEDPATGKLVTGRFDNYVKMLCDKMTPEEIEYWLTNSTLDDDMKRIASKVIKRKMVAV